MDLSPQPCTKHGAFTERLCVKTTRDAHATKNSKPKFGRRTQGVPSTSVLLFTERLCVYGTRVACGTQVQVRPHACKTTEQALMPATQPPAVSPQALQAYHRLIQPSLKQLKIKIVPNSFDGLISHGDATAAVPTNPPADNSTAIRVPCETPPVAPKTAPEAAALSAGMRTAPTIPVTSHTIGGDDDLAPSKDVHLLRLLLVPREARGTKGDGSRPATAAAVSFSGLAQSATAYHRPLREGFLGPPALRTVKKQHKRWETCWRLAFVTEQTTIAREGSAARQPGGLQCIRPRHAARAGTPSNAGLRVEIGEQERLAEARAWQEASKAQLAVAEDLRLLRLATTA